MPKMKFVAAMTICALIDGVPAAAAGCEVCDSSITISLSPLQCLDQEIEELITDARETNPLLIDLTYCHQGEGIDDMGRGEMPRLPPRISKPAKVPKPGNNDHKGNAGPTPVFLILSLEQLECLRASLAGLLRKSADPTEFDFASCRGN